MILFQLHNMTWLCVKKYLWFKNVFSTGRKVQKVLLSLDGNAQHMSQNETSECWRLNFSNYYTFWFCFKGSQNIFNDKTCHLYCLKFDTPGLDDSREVHGISPRRVLWDFSSWPQCGCNFPTGSLRTAKPVTCRSQIVIPSKWYYRILIGNCALMGFILFNLHLILFGW
jgi:hypothetical protein